LTETFLSQILTRMKLPFTPKRFKRTGEIASELGPLERQVMELIWRRPEEAAELSVRDVYLAFGRRLAYTTLMTTLDRLHKKGFLDRRKEGRAFFYSTRFSPDEFERGVARNVINKLLGRGANGVEPILACIVDAVSERDRALLDELDRLIKEKRRAAPRKG
jgi:predicted transcriptional regulator